MNFEKFTECFFQELQSCLNEVQVDQVKKAVEMLKEAYCQDKQIFFIGMKLLTIKIKIKFNMKC